MKKRRFQDEPLDALREADPIDSELLPVASEDPRAQALFDKITSQPVEEEAPKSVKSPRGWRLQPAWVAAAATAVITGVIGTVAIFGDGSPPDTSGGIASTGALPTGVVPTAGMCVEFYDLQTLTNRDFAFDGVVVGIERDEVTFAVNEWFRGDPETQVTLTATGLTGDSITPGSEDLTLVDGERYLVAGSGVFVWSCGFTQPYDSAIAADWGAVFGN